MSTVTADGSTRTRRTAGQLAHALLVSHLGYRLEDVSHVEIIPPGLLRVDTFLVDEDGGRVVAGDRIQTVTVEHSLIWPRGGA